MRNAIGVVALIIVLCMAVPAIAQETYIGTGMRLSPPWRMQAAVNPDEDHEFEKLPKQETVPYIFVVALVCGGPADRAGIVNDIDDVPSVG